MKNLLLMTGVLLMMVSCGPDYQQQTLDLQLKNDSLLNAYQLKNDELTAYMADLNQIQTSITELTQQENLLKNKSESDLTADAKTKVLSDLEAIRSALQSNKNKLAALQSKLKKSNAKIVELEQMIANLNNDIAVRDSSIALLSQTVMELSNKVDVVQTEMVAIKTDNETKSKEIADKTTRLNTAYYAVGTYKDLREKHVISDEGTIFKSKDINPNFTNDSFVKIDVTSTKSIFLSNVKSVKLASAHPSDSYTLVKENNKFKSIDITNPERFWAGSKYLIAVIQ